MGMHAKIRHKRLFFLDPETKRLSILGQNTPVYVAVNTAIFYLY